MQSYFTKPYKVFSNKLKKNHITKIFASTVKAGIEDSFNLVFFDKDNKRTMICLDYFDAQKIVREFSKLLKEGK